MAHPDAITAQKKRKREAASRTKALVLRRAPGTAPATDETDHDDANGSGTEEPPAKRNKAAAKGKKSSTPNVRTIKRSELDQSKISYSEVPLPPSRTLVPASKPSSKATSNRGKVGNFGLGPGSTTVNGPSPLKRPGPKPHSKRATAGKPKPVYGGDKEDPIAVGESSEDSGDAMDVDVTDFGAMEAGPPITSEPSDSDEDSSESSSSEEEHAFSSPTPAERPSGAAPASRSTPRDSGVTIGREEEEKVWIWSHDQLGAKPAGPGHDNWIFNRTRNLQAKKKERGSEVTITHARQEAANLGCLLGDLTGRLGDPVTTRSQPTTPGSNPRSRQWAGASRGRGGRRGDFGC